ncbi:MAG: type II secretion system protein E [Candidatus Micrarchaeum acidiphilum ARMAN-2]|jgi:flagellar protein FlaI|uniref:Type II secretion system protein E n=1 Tax=Candidatus Micrarchaeum acidiphilum ARMAN-2 TaxID=425595 RepID=C7DIM8_MICA2|nr:MAG: type II secretion system protein E [Candidatus Micrarchaeum acidiphilum ARMAN-2]
MDGALLDIEDQILDKLIGKFISVVKDDKRKELVTNVAKSINADISDQQIDEIYKDMNDLSPITPQLINQDVEDIMINNTKNIFVYDSKVGQKKLESGFEDREQLARFVKKMKLYTTNQAAGGNIQDIHLPTGSRSNVIYSPEGYDITIRNFKKQTLSVIDLVNSGTFDYSIAARLWLYMDGFRVRPANILIGGMPAAGKTTLLNSLLSFTRPEQRIIAIEETRELDMSMQENAVSLETNNEMPMVELVKNSLRMRPDLVIIGEVRGEEANDMITAMNIGKIALGTIHSSSTRDIINRLEHSPMNVPKDIIPVIDALMVVSNVWENGKPHRKVIQISEITGIETQILLSDLYKFDYKTHKASPILPSVQYRDLLSGIMGVPPSDILAEENVRAAILAQLNRIGKRDIRSISEIVRDYYAEPDATLKKIGLPQLQPIVRL